MISSRNRSARFDGERLGEFQAPAAGEVEVHGPADLRRSMSPTCSRAGGARGASAAGRRLP